jgi:predicted lipoprotein with Yx(FWY)xxD motif
VSKTLFMSGLIALGLGLAGCGGSSGGGVGSIPMTHPVAAPPASAPAPVSSSSATPGDTKEVMLKGSLAFVDAKTGLALYTFDGDTTPNQSNCTGSCLQLWPPHAATASETATGSFTIFKRSDNGTLQWAYLGKPLYTFISDTVSNNGTGEGIQNFHIARPQATATAAPTMQPTSAPITPGY